MHNSDHPVIKRKGEYSIYKGKYATTKAKGMVELHPPSTVSTAQQQYYESINAQGRWFSRGYMASPLVYPTHIGYLDVPVHPSLTAVFALLLVGILGNAHANTLFGWFDVTC